MARPDWEQGLSEGLRVDKRDDESFTLGVTLLGGEDGQWHLRCPEHPVDHIFKIIAT